MTTDQIDAALDLSAVKTEQDSYFNANGKYHYVRATPQGFDSSVTVECDGYDGPSGKGYVIIVASPDWIKVLNFGPETEREMEWVANI